ncbi:MAG: ATP-binding protein, partial [Actinomycetes bacterium]
TRLALAAARAAASAFADGVCWVPLAGLGDPAEVTPSLAHALGISDRGDRLLIETVGELLAERQLLVVLDNVEHLLPDAARLVGGLLAAAGDVVVLATSRAALHVAGEMRFPLAPLGLAALDLYEPHEVEAAPACALFLERARAVGRSMALTEATAVAVADLCARLDGLPLALELAAARTNVLSPGELLTRLNAQMLESSSVDAPARHRSLRATLQWSVDLLTPAEGRLLARLSVFRGGFTLDAAEAVVGTLEDLGAPTVDLLAELVDASLVVPADQETGRFAMLETIREFAADRLEAEEPAARAAHAAYYHRLFNPPDRVFPLWPRTPDEARRHALEQDNVRAAVAHAESVGDRMRLAGLATAVAGWRQVALLGSEADAWLRTAEANAPTAEAELAAMTLRGIVVAQSGDARAGRGPLEQALDHPAAGAAAHWRAAAGAQYALVLSLMTEGGDARVAGLVQDSLRMARGVDDPALLAFTLTCSGGAVTEFDVPLARALLEEAAAVGRDGPSHMSWFMAASNLAELELSCGDPIAARAWASTALDVEILRWAPTQRGYPLDLLGASLLALGQPDAAEPPLREALRLADWAADAGLLYEVVARFAALAAVRGDAPRAFTLLAAHQAGLDRHGIVRSASSRWLLGALIGDLGAADEERSRYEARGRGMSRPELVRYVLDGPPEGPSCQ